MPTKRKQRTRGAEQEPTTLLSARAKISVFELVDAAARIRGMDRQDVVLNGAVKEAYRIIEVALRAMRRHKDRQRRLRAEQRKKAHAQ